MDCCGMAMAAWPGGGYECRRCQAKVGVPWVRDRNRLARMVTEVPVEDMAAVYATPVVEPQMTSAEIQAGRDLLDMAAKVSSEKVPRGVGRRGIRG